MEDSDMPPFRQPPPTRLARELFANPKMCLVMHDDHEELDRRRRPTIYEAWRTQAETASSGGRADAPDGSGSFADHNNRLLSEAFERAGGNQSEAARILFLSRDRMRYKMAKFKSVSKSGPV